jgi:Domain of unknown function (DUF6916)
MVETFTEATFQELLNTRFRIYPEGADPVEVELVGLTPLSTPRQVQFSILFQGPGHVLLQQSIYPVAHDQLGEFELFLVPVARVESGFQYEAVFNRMVE